LTLGPKCYKWKNLHNKVGCINILFAAKNIILLHITKYINMKKYLAALACVMVIFSCQKEYSFSDENNNGGSGGGAGVCKSCSYFPTCDGSIYKYRDSGAITQGTSITTSSDTLKFVKDTLIAGVTYGQFIINSLSEYDTIYQNCTAGVSTSKVFNATSVGGTTTLVEATIIPLKDNVPINTTWQTGLNAGGQQVTYLTTVLAKGINKQVLGVNYSNVIETKVETQINIFGTQTTVIEDHNFFAKNIGLIENYSVDLFISNDTISKRQLISAQIP
jgi:hypothetical protein